MGRDQINNVISFAAFMGAVLTLAAPLMLRKLPADRRQGWKLVVVAGWILLPPFWFWIEYTMLFENLQAGDFELFRYGQDLSRNIWLGFLAVLYIFYFKLPEYGTAARQEGDPYYRRADYGYRPERR